MQIGKIQFVISFFILNFLLFIAAIGQEIEVLVEKPGISLRGLSVVSKKVIWASGNKGTVAISTDGGNSWSWKTIGGYESRDFRDIEAFDHRTAIIMAVGEPALILRTTDGGESWKKVYENKTEGMFLDAMFFYNAYHGMVIGDPIKGKFFIARTNNGGNSWEEIKNPPAAAEGEACFAASGANIIMTGPKQYYFVTGGKRSRLFSNDQVIDLPLLQGSESQGANAVTAALVDKKTLHIIVVGGDFANDTLREGNCVFSRDGGKTWINPSNKPYGYRSSVTFINDKKAITCGLNGVDISYDGGINWNGISAIGFHVCQKEKKGETVFLAGNDGRIARLIQ